MTLTWRFQDVTWKQCSYTALTWMFTALIFKHRIMRLARSSRGLQQRKGQKRWNQSVEWNCMHLQNKVIIYIRVITPPGKTSASSEHLFFPPSPARWIKSCSNRSLFFKWWWCCSKRMCPGLHFNPLIAKLFYSKHVKVHLLSRTMRRMKAQISQMSVIILDLTLKFFIEILFLRHLIWFQLLDIFFYIFQVKDGNKNLISKWRLRTALMMTKYINSGIF